MADEDVVVEDVEDGDDDIVVGDEEGQDEPQESEDEEASPEPRGDRSVESLKAQIARQAAKIQKLEAQGGLSAEDREALAEARRIQKALRSEPAAPKRQPLKTSVYDDEQGFAEEVTSRAREGLATKDDVKSVAAQAVAEAIYQKGIKETTTRFDALVAKTPSLQNPAVRNAVVRVINARLPEDGVMTEAQLRRCAMVVDDELLAAEKASAANRAEEDIVGALDEAALAAQVSGSGGGGAGGKRNLLALPTDRVIGIMADLMQTNPDRAVALLEQLEAKDPKKYQQVMEEIDTDMID